METKKVLTQVLADMVQAGWLKSHCHTEGAGLQLVWSDEGASNGMLLRTIAEKMDLGSGDRMPLAFDKLCRGKDVPAGFSVLGGMNDMFSSLWCELVDELGYADKERLLLGLVHVCLAHAVMDESGGNGLTH